MESERRRYEVAVRFVVLFAISVFLSVGCASGQAATLYVPDNYAKIQWAVDNASAGDTIIVRDGSYTENVDVNVNHLTIKSENGSDSTIVQAADSNDHVFEVTADYVTISGFTAKEAGLGKAGIWLSSANHCNISNNIALNNYNGIALGFSSNNYLSNNTARENIYRDLSVYGSDSHCNNRIENTTGSGNRPIRYYNSSVSLSDVTLSELVLCNAYGVNLRLDFASFEDQCSKTALLAPSDRSSISTNSWRRTALFLSERTNNFS